MDQTSLSGQKLKQSLRYCFIEGMPAAVMLSVMDYYVTPLALFMGAVTSQVGLLVAFPHLISSISLLYSTQVIQWSGSRKKFLIAAMILQALSIFLMALLIFMPVSHPLFYFALSVVLYKVMGNFIGSAWGSLTSEYLPAEERGKFFGLRSQVVGMVGLAGLAAAGILLYFMKEIAPAHGFFIVFLTASLCRLLSAFFMGKMSDLPMAQAPEAQFTFYQFIRQFRSSNFVKYVLFVASMLFASHLSASYFSVFMLRDLKFNYFSYMCIHFAHLIGTLVSFPVWGRHADIVGNASVMKTTSLLIAPVPLFWLFIHHPVPLFLIEFASGCAWGGFILCMNNFIYDAVRPEKRVRCIAYFNLIVGTAIFMGTTLGGSVAGYLPKFQGYSLLTLFLISSLLRFWARAILSKRFHEIRKGAKKVSSAQLFFSVIGVRPIPANTADPSAE